MRHPAIQRFDGNDKRRITCAGGGADSTWHQAFSLANKRTRAV
jgi:hypothetical protein